MTCIAVRCPPCPSAQLVQRGNTGCGPQRYLCQNPPCATGGLLRDSRYRGRLPAVQQQRIAMRLNASGVRDTARGLRSRPATGCRARRKTAAGLESVPPTCLRPPPTTLRWPARAPGTRRQRGMRGGRLAGTQATRAGCGMRWSTPPARAAQTSWGAAQTQSCCGVKRGWSPAGSRVFRRIMGGRTHALWPPTCIVRAHGTPRTSRASI